MWTCYEPFNIMDMPLRLYTNEFSYFTDVLPAAELNGGIILSRGDLHL